MLHDIKIVASSYKINEGRMMQKSDRVKNISRSKCINYTGIIYVYFTVINNLNDKCFIKINIITQN